MIKPQVIPSELHVRVQPGETQRVECRISKVPTATFVKASVAGDGALIRLESVSGFRTSYHPLTPLEKEGLPPTLPGDKQAPPERLAEDTQKTGTTDGTTSLPVEAGDEIVFGLEVTGPADTASPIAHASLIVAAPDWQEARVPITVMAGTARYRPNLSPREAARNAAPGECITQEFVIDEAPSGTYLIAYVAPESPIIRVSEASATERVRRKATEERDPDAPRDGEGNVVTYELRSRTEGGGPLAVGHRDLVKLVVRFNVPSRDFPETTNASLIVDARDWHTSEIPLRLAVGKVEFTLSASHVTVRQGGSVELAVTLTSIAGPDTEVLFTLDRHPEYFALEPAKVRLAKRATTTTSLRLAANQTAPAGTYEIGLRYTPFGDPRNSTKVPLDVTIAAAAIGVRLLDPHVSVMQGATAVCRVEATSEGGVKELRMQPGGLLPAGISLHAVPKMIDYRSGRTVVPVAVTAARDALPVAAAFTPIRWSAGDRANEGLLVTRTTVVAVPEAKTFRQTITTPAGTALGGWVELTIRSDGTSTFRGHMHGSGFDPYTFRVSVTVRSSNGWLAIAALKSGKVGGTVDSTSRDFDWSEDDPKQNALIQSNWSQFRDGTMSVNKQYENVGLLGSLEDVARVLVEFVLVSAVASPQAAAVIVLGSELAVRAGVPAPPPGLLAGMVVAGGVIWMFGPGVLLPAVAAGLVTAGQFRSRPLREEELRVANLVFKGTLPVERILITNLNRGDRAFCIPYGDRWILMGIGGRNDGAVDMYDDSLKHPEWRRLLIHELTHAWQIEHRPDHELIWDAALNEGRDQAEVYDGWRKSPFDGRAWGDYGLEAQASIVEEWFAKADARLNSRRADTLDDEMAKRDDYFVYIQNNIRLTQP